MTSRRPDELSQTDRIGSPIPVQQQRALGDVFDRWRLNQGWNPWDDETQMAAIASWAHSLDREGVPPGCYSELYERSLTTRARSLESGARIPQFGVELMLAEWPQLRNEIRQREVDAGRTLTASAPSQCLRCYGTGMERIYDEKGEYLGTRKGCLHEYLDEGDPYAAGIDQVIEAIKPVEHERSSVEICGELRRRLAYQAVTAATPEDENDAWAASKILMHAERYCRKNDEILTA